MASEGAEAGVEDSIIAAPAPSPTPPAAESPAAGPGPATLAHWLEVPPTPKTPSGLISSSNSSSDLPTTQRISSCKGSVQRAQRVFESTPRTLPAVVIDDDSEPLAAAVTDQQRQQQRRNRKRPTTREGRLGRRFQWTPDLRGEFMEKLLDCHRLNMMRITRAGALKPAFQRVAQEMIRMGYPAEHWSWQKVRTRYIESRKRWRQWLAAERSGTGPDANGRMQAPDEVFQHLFTKDPSARWLACEPLKNIKAYREVFATESATGEHISEAGEECVVPGSPMNSVGYEVPEFLDLTSDEDIDVADAFGSPPPNATSVSSVANRGRNAGRAGAGAGRGISRRGNSSSSSPTRSRRPRPATVLAAEALGDSISDNVSAALATLERSAEALVRAEPTELVAKATKAICEMDQFPVAQRLEASMKLAVDGHGTFAAAFLAMNEAQRAECVRLWLE